MSEIENYFNILEDSWNKYGDHIVLLYQLGKFYCNYGYIDDNGNQINNTPEISVLLNVVLTRHNKKKKLSKENPQLIGIQVDTLEKYLKPLLNADYTVIVYKETIDPPENKIKRSLYKIYTRGTFIEDNNFVNKGIACIYLSNYKDKIYSLGCCYINNITGEIKCIDKIKTDVNIVYDDIHRFIINNNPIEILICLEDILQDIFKNSFELNYKSVKFINLNPEYKKINYQNEFFKKIYNNISDLSTLEYLDLESSPNASICIILLLQYIYEHNELLLKRISKPEILSNDSFLLLANNAAKQLDIYTTEQSNTRNLSVLDIYFQFVNFGKRLLNQWIMSPECNPDIIKNRYEIVNIFVNDNDLRIEVSNYLKQIYDISSLLRKLSLQTIHPYELAKLLRSCENYLSILKSLSKNNYLSNYFNKKEIILILENSIKLIKNNFDIDFIEDNQETIRVNNISIDIFTDNCDNIKDIKKKIKTDEAIPKNIADILNKYYYLKSNRQHIPKVKLSTKLTEDGYIYVLTVTSKNWDTIKRNLGKDAEKYQVFGQKKLNITCDQLNEVNARLTENNYEKVYREYCKIIDQLYDIFHLYDITINLAEIDILVAFSLVALKYKYTKPELKYQDKSFLDIKGLRHPIVEIISDTPFVPNDVKLCETGILLFGLNTCGKSVLLKSVGIAVIMAQIGSFVPCDLMIYSPYKSIIPRITYDDDLYKRKSSFAVEMSELRTILNQANGSLQNNTLVLGDEICKGTEIESAVPIVACSIKFLCNHNISFILTTHLHKICELDIIKKIPNLSIMHLSVDIIDNKIIYKRKLSNGSGYTSYGIEVCKTLGLPKEFIEDCENLRNLLRDKSKELLPTKISRYNSKVYVDKCYICGSTKNLHTHHINPQHLADENGIISINGVSPFNKDKKHNLEILCENCHINIHQIIKSGSGL